LEPAEEAAVRFGFQVDRRGRRQPLKTDASRRTIELPAGLADALASHQLRSPGRGPDGFVFATRSGRPLLQRNVTRALRAAQRRARDEHGQPSFPGLHRLDGANRPLPPPQGSLPSFHSFRHTAAKPRDRRRRVGRGGRLAARPPQRHRHAQRLHPRAQDRRTARPPPPTARGRLRAAAGAALVSRPQAEARATAEAFFELVLRPLASGTEVRKRGSYDWKSPSWRRATFVCGDQVRVMRRWTSSPMHLRMPFSLPRIVDVGEQAGKRQLRIRARGASGRVAGAAKY
jgi:hypothetical protein